MASFSNDSPTCATQTPSLSFTRLGRSRPPGAKDALVAISLWRYLKDTIRPFELARTSGAKTVLIADSRLSPLAADAEITLTASAEAAELSHSLVSLVTLANVLATGVALSNPRRTVERLRTIDEFYDRFGVMSD